MTTTSTSAAASVPWGRVLPIALGGVVSHAFGRSTLQTVLPAIAEELALDPAIEGYLGTTVFGAYFLGVVLVTFIGARLAPFVLLRLGIAVVAAGLGVLAIANNLPMLFIGVGLGGLGGPGIWLSMPNLVAAATPPERRGAAMGALTGTMGVAFILVPAVTTAIREVANDDGLWRPTWVVAVVFSVGLLLYLTWFFEAPAAPKTERSVGMAPLFAHSWWRAAVTTYAAFAFVAASYGLFLGRLFEDEANFSRTFATMMFTVMGVGSIVGALGFGRLSDRFGRPAVIGGVLVLMAIALVGLTVSNAAVVIVAVFVVGSCSASVPSLIAAYTRDGAGDAEFTAVFGAMTIFYGPPSMVGPATGGWMGDAMGSFFWFYVLLAGAALVAASGAFRLPRAERHQGDV